MQLKTLSFINRKLIFSKQNRGIVHIIALISLIGIAVGSFALVVVLSVFNGFTSVAQTMLQTSCPPLLVEPTAGKVLDISSIENKLKSSDFEVVPVVSSTAMVSVGQERSIVTLFGIDDRYFLYNNLDSFIVNGKGVFDIKDSLFCFMGINEAAYLGLNRGAEKMNIPVKITVPSLSSEDAIVIEDKLTSISVFYQASYQTHSDLDEGLVFIPLSKAQELLSLSNNQYSSLYILPKAKKKTSFANNKIMLNTNPTALQSASVVSHTEIAKIQEELQKSLGNSYSVKDILQQEPVYFRIVKSEKVAVYIILAFIIFIASINIISSIIIFNIQKQKMNKIFRTMGMRLSDLRRIYFLYGMTINVLGCVSGIVIGLVLCFIQQSFGLISLAKDAFVVEAFPVKVFFSDIALVFVTVVVIGALSIYAVTSRIKA